MIDKVGHKDTTLYIVKRRFTARNMPDKEMRDALNEDVVTSEYCPSEKYAVVDDLDIRKRKFAGSHRRKKDAREWVKNFCKEKYYPNK